MVKHSLYFRTFRKFWPYYVSQHKNRMNQIMHLIGTFSGLSLALSLAFLGQGVAAVIAGLVAGYGCAWFGHFYFEKNRPATFHFPVYSLMGDFKLVYCLLTGRSLTSADVKK